MSRHMVWYELFDLNESENCPICELMYNRTIRSLDGFLYEGVNDNLIQDRISESNGLCNFHAHLLKSKGDPLAHSIIYTVLLEKAISKFEAPIKKVQSYQTHEKCIFCKQAEVGESEYIATFIDAFSDNEFKDKYFGGGLLCLPHLEIIRSHEKVSNVSEIIEITLGKYRMLIDHLAEIKRKTDYRFTDEQWTEQEKVAWKKAVDVINGKNGIRK